MKLLKFIVQQENQLAQQNFLLLGNVIKKPHAFFLELSNTDHMFAISTSCNKLHETHNVHNIFVYLIKKLIFFILCWQKTSMYQLTQLQSLYKRQKYTSLNIALFYKAKATDLCHSIKCNHVIIKIDSSCS